MPCIGPVQTSQKPTFECAATESRLPWKASKAVRSSPLCFEVAEEVCHHLQKARASAVRADALRIELTGGHGMQPSKVGTPI